MDIENDADNNDGGRGDPADSTLSSVAATSQKKLSGSTMNMKFMQRKNEMQFYANKNQQQRRQSSPKKQPTPAKAGGDDQDDPMQMDMDSAEDEEDSDGPVLSPLLQHQHPYTLGVKDAPIDMTPATTSDMYGISVDIIGRRSFGGFNKSIETTWKTSYRSHTENNNSNSNSSNKHVSDEELLSRYANLVKHRGKTSNGANNIANEDMSRKAIGNFGDKVKPRKQQQQRRRSSDPNRSGEKRKRR